MGTKGMTRRDFMKSSALALGGTAVLSGIAPNLVLGQNPIKVGIVLPLTGPMSGMGDMMKEDLMYYEEAGNKKAAGRPIELIFEIPRRPGQCLNKTSKTGCP